MKEYLRDRWHSRNFLLRKAQRTPQGLARAVLKVVKADDGRYDQTLWGELGTNGLSSSLMAEPVDVCGTSACVAGWAVLYGVPGARLAESRKYRGDYDFVTSDGEVVEAEDVAGELLGLDYNQAAWLFGGNRNKKDVIAALKHIADGEPEEIDQLIRNGYEH